jgi:ADP-heptose:LPS heptosyltransferase
MKVVPPENWKVVARHLLELGYQVMFLGGPGDQAIDVDGAIDFVGKFKIRETMAAVSLSAIHVCGDTGTGHIAAAYGTPVVSVFGHELPEIFRPYTDKLIALKEGDLASNVKTDQIVAAVDELRGRYGI